MKKKFIIPFITLILTSIFFSSCGKPKFYRYDVSNYISYIETTPDKGPGYVLPRIGEFKHLDKKNMRSLVKLISKEGNNLWLKIQFILPEEFKDKDIGLFIGYIRGADLLFLNNISIRQYGDFPPMENSAGFTGQYFMFSKSDLNQNGLNTVLIKVWPDAFGSISNKMFLGERPDVHTYGETITFYNSKITLSFAGVMLLIFFMYLFLYIVMKNYEGRNVYLFFALLNFYTIHFLLPFFASEVAWAKPRWLSYTMLIRFFFYGGAFTTIYFANSFIISYLRKKEKKWEIITRLIFLIIPLAIAFSLKTTKALNSFMPYIVVFGLMQFCFSIPKLIISIIHKETRKNSLYLIAGFSPVLAGVVLDIILKLGNLNNNLPFFTIYGWQVTLWIFLGSLLLRFGAMYMHNTELNSKLSEFSNHLEDVVALRTKELSEANYVLSKGLETVAHVQKNFLPVKNKSFRGWELAISYNALDNNVSGDLYDYYFTEGILDGIGIFDVSGHGIPAGLMTILAKSIISQHFINGMNQDESISNVLKDINKSYIKEKVNVENYITGLLFRFSEFNKKDVCSVEFANAGHPYPLLYSAAEDTVIELKQDTEKQYGILGVEGLDVSFPPVNFRAAQDDIIICYTDGLTDCMNHKGEEFGKERIIKTAQLYHKESAIMIMNRIMDKFADFVGSEKITDDITLIVLKRVNSKDYIEEI
ncbi:SpoIIE family protein phosphatase [Treponema bryantii]|uniref:SpoIIE family protein phosphatase n=1 Tax=Treponema bryantii TaxID=163 RepID=UPI0003F6E2E8|nr:SpoIIE family protein phosphatase [Treponema bryantii]